MFENMEKILEVKRNNKEKYTLFFNRDEGKFYVLEEDLKTEEKGFYEFDPRNEFLVKLILEEEFGGDKRKLVEFFEMFDRDIANDIKEVLRWV